MGYNLLNRYGVLAARRLGYSAVLMTACIAVGDNATPLVECLSQSTFPNQPCSSNTAKVTIRSEIGVGDDADFANASNLLVNVNGPNEQGDMDSVNVMSQKPLPSGGVDAVVRSGGQIVLVPGVKASSSLKQKDTIVLISPTAGTSSLAVDVSGGARSQQAGNVVVIADKLSSLSIKADGYNGLSGADPRMSLAVKALAGDSAVPSGIATSYKARRDADQNLAIPFDLTDLNNYTASGLTCRADETAVGPAGSYAYDTAQDPGSVPQGLSVTAYAREESKRAYCQRTPEFTVSQDCEAEREYSFQAVCKVQPEGKSLKFYRRDPVRWERALCASGLDTQIRRKIVRSAYIEISIPGVKSYSGPITREITFDQTYNVYKKAVCNTSSSDCSSASDDAGKDDEHMNWISPFWQQADNIPANASLQIKGSPGALSVANGYNGKPYPTSDTLSGNGTQGAKLTFVPKNSRQTGKTDLLSFKTDEGQTQVFSQQSGAQTVYYTVNGCSSVIDPRNSFYSSIQTEEGNRQRVVGDTDFSRYVDYYQAFDSRAIGFSHEDLKIANIRVSNCFAYEVMDGIVQGEVVNGNWSLATDNAESLSPTPTTTSLCPTGFPNRVGTETFVQYEREEACYADDPRSLPDWLKKQKCNELRTAGKITIDCDAPAQVNTTISEVDFQVFELFSKDWTRATGTASAQPTAKHGEFTYPSSVTAAEVSALTSASYDAFCVPIDQNASYASSNQTSLSQLTRSIAVPKFVMRQGTNIAVPTGQYKTVCPAGMRLDNYLASVPRPTCPASTSTLLKLSNWSAVHGDPVWSTWSQKGANTAPPEHNYSLRSEYVDTRYDDLPQQIFTAKTHEVHPSVSIASAQSFSGDLFPPVYKDSAGSPFTELVAGVTQRLYPGWTREGSIKNRTGAFITPDTFTPFDGATLFDRSTAWCNAQAFQNNNGAIVKSFGAKGILRDTAKHVYGFKLEEYDPSTDTKIGEREYVGVEIVSVGQNGGNLGFYGNGIYGETGGQTSVPGLNSSLGKSAFLSKNYPFLGSRFVEACDPGELYNEFTGYCHAAGEPWKASKRTVQRVLQDGRTRELWAVPFTKQRLTDSSDKLDQPFCGGQIPCVSKAPGEIDMDADLYDIYRLGFMRPLAAMVDDSVIKKDIFMNRPETVDQMVLGPGFAASLTSETSTVCRQQFRMVAVPVDANTSVPVTVNLNEYLPSGSVFLAVDTECPQGVYAAKATVRRFGSGALEPSQISVGRTSHEIDGLGGIKMILRNGADRRVLVLKEIKESISAGFSATTGQETLSVVELSPPQVRNRASEWDSSRQKGGKGWQTQIKTTPTNPSQDQNTSPLGCSAVNVRDGLWASGNGLTPNILNSSSSLDCRLSTSACALSEEELSLFSKPVSNSKNLAVTRPAAVQFTPWSHELPSTALKDPGYASSKPFGAWTQIIGGQDGAPVPSCAIYDGANGEADSSLSRQSFDLVTKTLDSPLYKIKKPNASNADFLVLPEDQNIRKSDACVKWDGVTGQSCDSFYPTVGGPETGALVFGGKWQTIYVESKDRLAQTCRGFETGLGGELTNVCKSGKDPQQVDYRQANGSPRVEFCTPGSCAFQTNTQTFQVEASTPVSGLSGEDGTNSGGATVFCRDCQNVTFQGRPGSGGIGSSPVSSSRSKTLTCVSWNQNPLAPIFSVRNLSSQPFVGGSSGQNGRPGQSGGQLNVFSDMTPEAIFQVGDSSYWLPQAAQP